MKTTLNHTKYTCQGIEIDPVAGCVIGQTETIRLGPVNMRVLEVLIESAGSVVTRADIFEKVWQNQIVSDDVLTRCISDLRKQLSSLFSDEKIIETLPKRGYRWMLSVECQTEDSSPNSQVLVAESLKPTDNLVNQALVETPRMSESKAQIKDSVINIELSPIKIVIYSLLGLLFLSTSSLWLVESFYSTNYKKVALLPIESNQANKALASEIEQLLSTSLFEIEELRVLAKSAIRNRPQNHFTYFTREFGTDWIIEGNLSEQPSGVRLTLNLVDARSATVSYSQTEVFAKPNENLKKFCENFADKLKVLSE